MPTFPVRFDGAAPSVEPALLVGEHTDQVFSDGLGMSADVKAGTYRPGNGCPDGIHYDVKGNLWAQMARLGGIVEIDPRGIIIGFVPIPDGDLATTNFAFGGPDNQYIYFEGATSGTFWRFKAPYPGLIGPGGVRLPAQP